MIFRTANRLGRCRIERYCRRKSCYSIRGNYSATTAFFLRQAEIILALHHE